MCEPLFERGFIHDSYANRTGKGTHRAVACYERFRDRFRHVLRCDTYRYFPAIDHEILKRDLSRRIACLRTLALADRIVDGSNPQEPVPLYYPGDDLFTPFECRRGLPIGNLTSQLFANVYLHGLDHFCKEVLRTMGETEPRQRLPGCPHARRPEPAASRGRCARDRASRDGHDERRPGASPAPAPPRRGEALAFLPGQDDPERWRSPGRCKIPIGILAYT